jgi:hypothetical protein
MDQAGPSQAALCEDQEEMSLTDEPIYSSGEETLSPPPKKRREVLPPSFDGQGIAFQDHLVAFRRIAEFNRWKEEECCFHLWQSISGSAKIKILALPYERRFKKMVGHLERLFCSNRAVEAHRTKWQNVSRPAEMDLESYAFHLLDLSRKANPATSEEEQERFAKEKFTETAGQANMRFWLRALRPQSLQDAIDLATQYEAAHATVKPVKPDLGAVMAIGEVGEADNDLSSSDMTAQIRKVVDDLLQEQFTSEDDSSDSFGE